jgi:hypothetical protein
MSAMTKLAISSCLPLRPRPPRCDHAGRQVLHDRQASICPRLALEHAGARSAPTKHAAVLVVALDRGRARAEADVGHALQRHRAAAWRSAPAGCDRAKSRGRLGERRTGSGSAGPTARTWPRSGRSRRAWRCGSPGSAPGWSRPGWRRGLARGDDDFGPLQVGAMRGATSPFSPFICSTSVARSVPAARDRSPTA